MKKTKLFILVLLTLSTAASVFSCGKLKVAMEYGKNSVSANMYSYWVSEIKSNYVTSSQDTESYWNTEISDGFTYADRMKEVVDKNVKINLVASSLFDEKGLELSDDTKTQIEKSIDGLIDAYGSKSNLNKMLSDYGVNYSILRDIYTVEAKVYEYYSYLYREGGERYISDERIDEYYKENYKHVSAIIVYTGFEFQRDDDGNITYDDGGNNYQTRELTEEEKAAKRDKVSKLKERLAAGEDFDALKAEFDEDPNSGAYTDGYYMSASDYAVFGAKIVSNVLELGEGETVDFEEGGIAYFFKGLPLEDKAYEKEENSTMFSRLRDGCQTLDFNEYIKPLLEEVTVHEDAISEYSVASAPLIKSDM